MDSEAQNIQHQILDNLANAVANLYYKLTAERDNRLDLQGERGYLTDIHLTLLNIDNNINDLLMIEEMK